MAPRLQIILTSFLLIQAAAWIPGVEANSANPCKSKQYGTGSVCVCDEEYCDTVPPVGTVETGTANVFTSNTLGARLKQSTLQWTKLQSDGSASTPETKLAVNASNVYQEIIGFGGAFTDAAGINIASLKGDLSSQLIAQYFGDQGLKYTIGRVPIASCDFSTHEYSYDDVKGDYELKNFKLAPEDFKYKIPFIKKAQSLSSRGVKLFGSPWSAPAWLKTSGTMHGNGSLIGTPGDKHYTTWANYFLKFLDAYQAQNIHFWGLTAQNEPTTGFIYNYSFQTMAFTPELQRDFIKMNLGPALAKSQHAGVKLMILDDQRLMLPKWAQVVSLLMGTAKFEVLEDAEAAKYVSGIGIHWYYDRLIPPGVLDATHSQFPATFMLSTEACLGALPPPLEFHRGPLMGSWMRAERYASDIIQNLNHWVSGWTDWNLVLDEKGGPNWVKNVVDAPIIVNSTGKEYYKQPMFYALAHFSAYIEPGAHRIEVDTTNIGSSIHVLSILNKGNQRVLVVLNTGLEGKIIQISDVAKPGQILQLPIKSHEISTLLWDSQ